MIALSSYILRALDGTNAERERATRLTQNLVNFFGLLALFVLLSALVTFSARHACRTLIRRAQAYAYKPVVEQSELVVDL